MLTKAQVDRARSLNTFYSDVTEITSPHVFVFTSNKGGSGVTDSYRIAQTHYGRTVGPHGFQKTHKGSTYGIIIKDERMVKSIPHDMIDHSLRVLYYLATQDQDYSYVLPNFMRGVQRETEVFLIQVCRELFVNYHDKNIFILPDIWAKFDVVKK